MPVVASSSSGEEDGKGDTHDNETGDGGRGGADGDRATSGRTFDCVNSVPCPCASHR